MPGPDPPLIPVSMMIASGGSVRPCLLLRGYCPQCGPPGPEGRPVWLERSVATPDWDVPTDRSYAHLAVDGDTDVMVILGVDAHERSHTVVAVDEIGRQLEAKTLGTTTWRCCAWPPYTGMNGCGRLRTVGACRVGWNVICWPLGGARPREIFSRSTNDNIYGSAVSP